ncbi:hypothetical protein [Picrophilus oshimae]|uniref:V/A-type H+-transporting ATPase subunit G/H n=1 Tax=Picrophilus torridus (strain ATCC 700027 / DSM 9790 / JCM 10055 / NBRC 100828 / KAW 2/3) TaxID=1122961 RepID=A0A8G2FW66_PICTO|nr:hypothetical protein [Picrophilus oshimae]SMD30621.1 V/A-type H+-transporting ATPase subunit G/H [Picrophilus oshimae DSM 9789]
MTELDELKVIKDKEESIKKEIENIIKEKENEIKEIKSEYEEKAKSTEEESLNMYNAAIMEARAEEEKRYVELINKAKAEADLMKLKLSEDEIREFVINRVIEYLKE